MYSHIGIVKRSKLKKGSSEESWTMSKMLDPAILHELKKAKMAVSYSFF